MRPPMQSGATRQTRNSIPELTHVYITCTTQNLKNINNYIIPMMLKQIKITTIHQCSSDQTFSETDEEKV